MSVPDTLWDLIISGGYYKGGSWGGPICASYVPAQIHYIETGCWVLCLLALFTFGGFNLKLKKLEESISLQLKGIHSSRIMGVVDNLLSLICFANVALLLYYKVKLHSLINLLQPCHITTFLQAIALSSKSSLGVMIGMLNLMMVVGSGGAILFPDTSGLDFYFEVEAFWIQHILLQTIPIYLLLRHDALGARLMDFKTLMIGNWILVFVHWVLFEVSIL